MKNRISVIILIIFMVLMGVAVIINWPASSGGDSENAGISRFADQLSLAIYRNWEASGSPPVETRTILSEEFIKNNLDENHSDGMIHYADITFRKVNGSYYTRKKLPLTIRIFLEDGKWKLELTAQAHDDRSTDDRTHYAKYKSIVAIPPDP